ncbi:predicted protein [Histoplasma capsulatum var. duboisii H88]|uniref:CFEM domain-containing protein n=1 Tax=Ajellomyces capsulatus (strain H88) TaxID=544711 RepID=F0UQF4_AJEC8|nr:predicted protein [Histoplasma capsulatum var. duboisii H88]QSS54098.1 CFEM domain-containing protein [Histoplasma capsulatum var. duboisii H88]
MKPNSLLLVLSTFLSLTAPAYSQNKPQIPKCALACQDSVERVTDCRRDDYKCICKPENFDKIVEESGPCVSKHCGTFVALNEVLPAMQKFCEDQK